MGFHNTKVSVGNTTTTLVAANANRRSLILVNDSNEDIYVARGAAAVLNEGIRLNAGGGTYEHDSKKSGAPVEAFNGICASGTKNMTVQEGRF
jgi:hypothetical protein